MCWIIHQIIFRLFCLCCLQDDFSSHCFIWRLFNNSEISYINPDSWILKCRHYYYELISDLIKQPMFGLQQRTDWICLLGKGSEWAGSNLNVLFPDFVLRWPLTKGASCSSLQEEVSESDIDDSFRSMFAQLSGDVSSAPSAESGFI